MSTDAHGPMRRSAKAGGILRYRSPTPTGARQAGASNRVNGRPSRARQVEHALREPLGRDLAVPLLNLDTDSLAAKVLRRHQRRTATHEGVNNDTCPEIADDFGEELKRLLGWMPFVVATPAVNDVSRTCSLLVCRSTHPECHEFMTVEPRTPDAVSWLCPDHHRPHLKSSILNRVGRDRPHSPVREHTDLDTSSGEPKNVPQE